MLQISRNEHSRKTGRQPRRHARSLCTGNARKSAQSPEWHTRSCQMCAALPRRSTRKPYRIHYRRLRISPFSTSLEWNRVSLAQHCAAFLEISRLIGENPTAGNRLARCSQLNCKATMMLLSFESYVRAIRAMAQWDSPLQKFLS